MRPGREPGYQGGVRWVSTRLTVTCSRAPQVAGRGGGGGGWRLVIEGEADGAEHSASSEMIGVGAEWRERGPGLGAHETLGSAAKLSR